MNADQLSDWQNLLAEAATRVLQPFLAFKQQDSLLYWPYLVSTLALALAVFWFLRRPRPATFIGEFRKAYFSKAIWGHASAKADYKFYLVNAVVFPLVFTPIILSAAWLAGRIDNGLTFAVGSSDFFVVDETAVKLVYTVVFFLAYDFGRYLAHWLQHRFDILWQFHKVHHSAEVLTPFTNYRAHPIDLVCMATVPALFIGIAAGIFIWLFKTKIGLFTYLGLHVLIFGYNLIGNLRHSHVWLSYGPRLSYLLISPAQHQIHHSVEPRHFSKNVGFALAVWDWLFGTIYVPKGEERFAMGLGDGSEAEYHGVFGMYFRPLHYLLRGKREPPTQDAGDAGRGIG